MSKYVEKETVMQAFSDRVMRSNNSDFAPVPTWNDAVQIVDDFTAAAVVPWEWLKRYAHGKGRQDASTLIFEAMDEWGKENQG